MGKPFGGMKGTGGGGAGGQAATQGFENFLSQGINQGVFGGGNFGSAINSMLQGQVGDPNSLGSYFAQLQNGGNGGLPQGQLGIPSTYNPAQYQGFTPQNPGVIDGSFNAPQFQQTQLQGFDPNQFGINPATLNAGFGTTAQLGGAGSADVDGAYGQAVRQILAREQEKQVGDLRARYGATGSGLGSNAQFAESNFRAENTPRIAAALGDINMQERGLNLQQRGQDLQNFLGSRGLDINQLGAMQNAGALGLQGTLGLNAQNLQQGLAQNQFNQGNAQFGAQQNMQAQGMNMDALMQMNQLMQQQNQFQNQFGMQNNQFSAQNQMDANQFNVNALLQNQQMQNQFGLGKAQVGMGLQGQQAAQQQAGVQAWMNMLMQNQGLNTAQRQQVYQPGWVQQGLGVAQGIAGIAGMFQNPLGSMMGQGQSIQPQISAPTPSAGYGGMYGAGNMMPLVQRQVPSIPGWG